MKKYNLSFFIIIFLLIVSAAARADADKKSMLILPFSIHSEKDFSFLQSGLYDMIATRMSSSEKINIIEKEKAYDIFKNMSVANEKTALEAGKKLSADYVAFGFVTVMGESISTDIKVIDVKKEAPAIVFAKIGEKQGDIISHAALFAAEANNFILGKKSAASSYSSENDNREKRNNLNELIGELNKDNGIKSSNEENTTVNITEQLKRLKSFDGEINGISVADVNGDGKNEVVFITDNSVEIYGFTMSKFIKLAEIKDKLKIYISLDAGDINNNGIAEIFVTDFFETKEMPKSFVLEWNGKKYVKIADNINMFLRLVKTKSGNDILLGQERDDMGRDIFDRNIYEMRWENGSYKKGAFFKAPSKLSVLSTNYFADKENESMIGFTDFDKVAVFDKNDGKKLESAEYYGGGFAFIESKYANNDFDDKEYFPLRILIDNDNIILAKNEGGTGRLFKGLRKYKNSYMLSLNSDKIGFAEKWKTRKLEGYISDYAAADLDNDGTKELLFVLVGKKGKSSFFSGNKSESYIFCQKIN